MSVCPGDALITRAPEKGVLWRSVVLVTIHAEP